MYYRAEIDDPEPLIGKRVITVNAWDKEQAVDRISVELATTLPSLAAWDETFLRELILKSLREMSNHEMMVYIGQPRLFEEA